MKNWENFFSQVMEFMNKKKHHSQSRLYLLRMLFFFVFFFHQRASTREKSCLQFRMPTEPVLGRQILGVSNSLDKRQRESLSVKKLFEYSIKFHILRHTSFLKLHWIKFFFITFFASALCMGSCIHIPIRCLRMRCLYYDSLPAFQSQQRARTHGPDKE